mmetsp:Transcript_163374/g.523818  ORF Transcript_163374/g.523818 Transcript_163374/m.523818 type:complete len:390 (-) Transcript_163374:150-1319(-)|eukprot:CAMPEP_0203883612 /NCGR_PEP_ID=MMETSP0359-20131031/27720_1 /ASSEMBLY_ACC=CAM_ASM_000338 /TAXON_ID=268821 /ORGANISM="Scrippsiella Hangoei, Strain SHTV-5" /LENGTH=389 /DNA_ID=CAMNT_0050803887 /DNA_START=83 /DNA_END=1252 /DNA_ORIENTATION=+
MTLMFSTRVLMFSSRTSSRSSISFFSSAARSRHLQSSSTSISLGHSRGLTPRGASISAAMSALSFPMLEGSTFVSVDDCLEALQASESSSSVGTGSATDDGPKLVFVDGSWYHRGDRNGRREFEDGPRVAGVRHIDMDDIAAHPDLFPDLNPKGLPHMLPPARLFAAFMDECGIANSDHVIIYGKDGCVFTPRIWFLFRSMGHDPSKIHLMQGPFEEWEAKGGSVESGRTMVPQAADLDLGREPSYRAADARNVVGMGDILKVLDEGRSMAEGDTLILDPRGSTFSTGHMPGAIHIPYASLVEKDNALRFKPKEELLRIFEDAGVVANTDKRIICSCGSGVSACHLVAALEECGRDVWSDDRKTVIYDGSWAEFGFDPEVPDKYRVSSE